jgi:CNT family concentrative nucleoside transporter
VPPSSAPGAGRPPGARSDSIPRATAGAAACLTALLAYLLQDLIGSRGQAACGAVAFLLTITACSRNVRAIDWRTVGWGVAIQWLLALFILKLDIGGVRPGQAVFEHLGMAVSRFVEFAAAGGTFVFGGLADPRAMSSVFPGGFVFAFTALPAIIFVSSFFSVLYHFGILQYMVRLMARATMMVMRTSGAETLSVAANVFLGHVESPLIVKPYVPLMTRSELLAMMVGGLATISGGMMVVYVGLGVDPVAILATSVMAAPCSLYLAKILYPETEQPLTRAGAVLPSERTYVNAIDAASAGAAEGTSLAINVAAMLIAFLAFIAMFDYVLGLAIPGLSLARIFATVFAPLAILMGTPSSEVPAMADLLGTKLVANEMVAFIKMSAEYQDVLSERSRVLAAYALTGFANFGSIGILLGGIGGLAPSRRGDIASLSGLALLGGFFATLINACVASILL